MLVAENGTTREYLIAAAKQLLDEGGADAVTLREVGHRAVVSHNAVYRHFVNRAALLAAAAERDLDELTLLFTDALEPDSDKPVAELRTALLKLLVFARAHPARYNLILSDASAVNPDGTTQQKAITAFNALAELIRACQDAGELVPGDPLRLGMLMFATVNGLIDLELGGRLQNNADMNKPEEIVELLFQLVGHPQVVAHEA
jgi:AcrR family transcriptional regulator